MKNKAVFLDRDGTINLDFGYVYQPEKFVFIRGAIEALRLLKKDGFTLIMITNQSGIARGYYSENEFLVLNNYMNETLKKNGAEIDGIYFCPHLSDCECRKPKLKLFYDAIKDWNIDTSASFAVGDKSRDLAISEVEPVKGILLSDLSIEGKTCCHSLLDAAKLILQLEGRKNG